MPVVVFNINFGKVLSHYFSQNIYFISLSLSSASDILITDIILFVLFYNSQISINFFKVFFVFAFLFGGFNYLQAEILSSGMFSLLMKPSKAFFISVRVVCIFFKSLAFVFDSSLEYPFFFLYYTSVLIWFPLFPLDPLAYYS